MGLMAQADAKLRTGHMSVVLPLCRAMPEIMPEEAYTFAGLQVYVPLDRVSVHLNGEFLTFLR